MKNGQEIGLVVKTMIELHPTKCNLCHGQVIYTSNSLIYGKEYGSGKMYYCTKCAAYVSTHKEHPEEAMGILANEEMRNTKIQCHRIFDKKWKDKNTSRSRHLARRKAYRDLAIEMGIPVAECHFGYFDKEMLEKAYRILKEKETIQLMHKNN